MEANELYDELSEILNNINPIISNDYDKSKYVRVRAWVVTKTDKAILLKGHHFKQKWIPLKYIIEVPDSKRQEYLGITYAWLIEKWLLK